MHVRFELRIKGLFLSKVIFNIHIGLCNIFNIFCYLRIWLFVEEIGLSFKVVLIRSFHLLQFKMPRRKYWKKARHVQVSMLVFSFKYFMYIKYSEKCNNYTFNKISVKLMKLYSLVECCMVILHHEGLCTCR